MTDRPLSQLRTREKLDRLIELHEALQADGSLADMDIHLIARLDAGEAVAIEVRDCLPEDRSQVFMPPRLRRAG